ncbi:MAG: ABC transporter permease [Leptolyngbya sp. PLA3]|nr:MAG: ABC transporter permease [Cyanobacteria bacterium CYA]MCE7967927.1 ABC transporter permease [Leptolyngbya sp. PL-A3]
MNRVFHIALREFKSTALTKGFIIGGIVVPLVLLLVISLVMPKLMNEKVPVVKGTVAVIDQTGVLTPAIEQRFAPEAVEAWQKRRQGQVVAEAAQAARDTQGVEGAINAGRVVQGAAEIRADLSVEMLAPLTDEKNLAIAKQPLGEGTNLEDGGRMALVVIDADAIEAAPGASKFGGFQIFTRQKLDDRVIDLVRDQVREAIRATRIEAAGMNTERLEALMNVSQSDTQEIGPGGVERKSLGEWNIIFQFAFMLLMMMSVFISGQYLLTTTIEEKSSRVVELLLASTSSMSLMAGKIFGQMCVGLFLVLVYGSLGFAGMFLMERAGLVSPMMIVWFFCFYFIAYTTVASLMAAIGSAVNDLREAQSLMTPVMIIVMIPYLLWLPIARDPNGVFATVSSFVPGVSPFVMMVRLSSTTQPPVWQVLAAIGIGLVSAYGCVWLAAKIFRVGLLQFGKAPNYATMWRWIRMA